MLSTPVRKKMDNWLRKQLFIEDDKGSVERFVLRRMGSPGRYGSAITRYRGSGAWTVENLDDLINEVESDSSADADNAEGSGQRRYALVAEFPKEQDNTDFQFYFAGRKLEDGEGSVEIEAPTKTGEIAQVMRHAEVAFRGMSRAYESTHVTLLQENRDLRIRVKELEDERYKYMHMKSDDEDRRTARELAVIEAVGKGERNDQIWDRLSTLGTIAVKRLTGKNIDSDAAEGATAGEMLILRFIELVPEETVVGGGPDGRDVIGIKNFVMSQPLDAQMIFYELQAYITNKYMKRKKTDGKPEGKENGK